MPTGPRPRGGPPLFLILAAAVGGCGEAELRDAVRGETPGEAFRADTVPSLILEDQAGRTVALPGVPQRIVSLVPAATVALLELGAADRLVGRTDFDTDPGLRDLPSVGGGIGPSMERLVSLAPDLVIRFEGEQDRATPPALDRAGIPHVGVRPDGIDDVRSMIRLLGRAISREEEAGRLVDAIDADLAEVRARVAGAPRPSVVFLLGGDPPWVAAEGTFLHELLEIAGGENALAGAGSLYAPVSVEEVVRRDVDLLVAPEGARIPGALRDLPLERVPDEVQSPGVGLAASARAISRVLHPERWR